ERIPTKGALSGEVYIDDESGQNYWYQMSPGGGIYHYDAWAKDWFPTGAAGWATWKGQKQIPIFKLVCPDKTGGSRECIITNVTQSVSDNPLEDLGKLTESALGFYRPDIGAAGERVHVAPRIVGHPVLQGSYNYAETIEEGYAAHKRFDVHTDPM